MTQTSAQALEYTHVRSSDTDNERAARSGASPSIRRRSPWPGRILKGIPLFFLSFDAGLKVLELLPATQGTAHLGYPVKSVFTIGVIELVCVIACLVPRTAVLGAILVTAYLGGAVATHVRVDSPLFSHTLFPVYVASLLWAGLWLNDPNLRRVFPLVGTK